MRTRRPLPPSFEAVLLHDWLVQEEVMLAWWRSARRFPPVTLGLIGACVVGFAASGWVLLTLQRAGAPRMRRWTLWDEALFLSGAREHDAVLDGELWRMGACIFLHGGPLHLALNMLALFGLGRLCETAYGPWRMLWMFLASGLAGSALSQLGGTPLSVGASGGVFGLLGAGVVFGLRYRADLPEPMRKVFGRGLLPWVFLNLFIGFAIPGIDNLGHIGGLLGGAACAAVLGSRVVPWSPQRERWTPFFAVTSLALLGWIGWAMARAILGAV
ncbi:MAG: rhomboid family intramembrane serine protease [Alphaproteobacteria bacterium]|nr:rhomboid family intramembrane serine protease [Alphaproteobacteria bacterium]